MKKRFLLPALLSIFSVDAAPQKLDSLTELRWKNRIILIFSENRESDLAMLHDAKEDISDRDTLWFIVNGNETLTNYSGTLTDSFSQNTRERYLNADGNVLLIGKDGGVKARGSELSLNGLFQRIDGMPMRRNEMRQKQK